VILYYIHSKYDEKSKIVLTIAVFIDYF